ncbi:type II secretion system protein GspK [Aporhodopirellula aestuarii]|uniref:Type II secretion system protein GspK n=1 Tax=Aporhodopirellula aestuarii TaxID=2950107 RepID=A0ABT0U433_9BACT|nr:type II secretion system protein GspK [Aporhodopirellula aestuarii]MCM2371686.1 type II secretion system protein GspK [Aporhodopirellula aestuarii]
MTQNRFHRRHGFFLVLVLIVVAVATMAVYSFTELMLAADETAYLQGDLVQARLNVDTGVEAVRLILASSPADRDMMGGTYENSSLFRAVAITNIVDGPVQRFTVLAPGISDTGSLGGIRFGLQNESARINVNALLVLEENSDAISMLTTLSSGSIDAGGILGEAISGGSSASLGDSETLDAENIAVQLLMTLPGMDESIADAILDWIDTDTEPRPLGCEDEYYSSLTTPYACPNKPLQSVEELLLVRGVTPQLLFGADTNRNGVLDLDEQQRTAASIDTAGVLGWASYLTVHGGENNKTAAGDPRVNINGEDLEVLYDELLTALGDEGFASFIVAYRMAGKSSLENSAAILAVAGGGGGDEVTAPSGSNSEDDSEKEFWTVDALADLDLTAGAGIEINQVLDLIDAEVTIGEGDNAVVYMSPFISDPTLMAEYLPLLVDQLTTQDVDVLPGRINLNEAPAEILAGISLVDADTMAAILEARNATGAGTGMLGGGSSADRTHETWPLTEGIVTLDQMRALLPLVTAGGDVFRAQVIGFDETSGLAARGEAIIDATTLNPRVIAYRDLTHLGRGFELSVLRGY